MTTDQGDWGDIDGVILDAVGTLIEPNPPVPVAYAEAARRQGLDLDPDELKGRFRESFRVDEVDERLGPLATDEETETRRWRRIVSNVLPEVPDPERAFVELWEHFGSASAWRAFDDAAPTLDALRDAGVAFVIASNFDRRLRGVVAGLSPLAEAVDRLVISSEVGYRKPHARFYLEAARRLGLDPARVLCVGDDEENDVRGPERAGFRGLLVDRDGRRPPGVARVVPDLTSVATALRSRGNGLAVGPTSRS